LGERFDVCLLDFLAAADLRGIANSPVLTNLLDQPLGLI
jgi:hypothetical protein